MPVVDVAIDVASHAARQMALGLDAVLSNFAVAQDADHDPSNVGAFSESRLFVDDRCQLAMERGACSVRPRQEDLASADTVALRAAGLLMGRSAHGNWQVCRAHAWLPCDVVLRDDP
jgi:thiazole synthase ThiGH ThiG subunit